MFLYWDIITYITKHAEIFNYYTQFNQNIVQQCYITVELGPEKDTSCSLQTHLSKTSICFIYMCLLFMKIFFILLLSSAHGHTEAGHVSCDGLKLDDDFIRQMFSELWHQISFAASFDQLIIYRHPSFSE